jgi:hypothetical protein
VNRTAVPIAGGANVTLRNGPRLRHRVRSDPVCAADLVSAGDGTSGSSTHRLDLPGHVPRSSVVPAGRAYATASDETTGARPPGRDHLGGTVRARPPGRDHLGGTTWARLPNPHHTIESPGLGGRWRVPAVRQSLRLVASRTKLVACRAPAAADPDVRDRRSRRTIVSWKSGRIAPRATRPAHAHAPRASRHAPRAS